MRWAKLFAMAIGLLAAAPAHAQSFPERGRAAVVDAANVIPDDEEAALAARLTAWERETGHQLVVATVPSLEGRDITDYSNGLFRHWRLGRAGVNDGVLLLLAPTERRVRIEVGYGLEPVLTDTQTFRIIRESIQPALRKDAIGIALSGGADRIMAAASASLPGRAATPARLVSAPPQRAQDDDPSLFTVLLLSFTPAIIVVLILVWLFRRGRKPPNRGPGRPLSKRAQRRRAAAAAAAGVTWDYGSSAAASSYSSWDNSSSSSWDSGSSSSSWDSGSSYSSDSGGGFDSGGGSSGGGGSDSSY